MPAFTPFAEFARASDGYAMTLVAEFADTARTATSMRALGALLAAATRDLGFRYHALVEHADLARPPPNLLFLQNYPAAWVETFAHAGLHRQDPAQRLASRRPCPFAWEELPQLIPLTVAQGQLLDQARRAGLETGFTVPLHAAGQRTASCSFVTAMGRPLPRFTLLAAELLAHIAFAAAFDLRHQFMEDAVPHLTPREEECVTLMAQGKTDWEIGVILGLSEETVTKYLKAARNRFGVTRRAQLAIAAVSRGQLGLDELAAWQ